MTIAAEARALITAALCGDPGLASLALTGSTPSTLAATIAPGVPAKSIGGSVYNPQPPFRREILTELAVRVQCLRWRRSDGFTRVPDSPTVKDLQTLRTKHARALVTFECGPGWADLFDAVFTWLNDIAPDHHWSPSQIKAKYGTLRFYWHGELPPLGDEIIEAAEHISGHLCETCGAPGRLLSQQGWLITSCHEHKNGSPS
ncbi:MAG: hypothetical protein WBA73_08325 [Devosia sp.]